MKYFLSIVKFLVIFFILSSSGFSMIMRENDVIYGTDNATPQQCLSQWHSEVMEILSRHNVADDKGKEIEELIKSYQLKIDSKEIKSAYCRFGYIGNDLYLSIKIRQKEQSGYSYKDVYLAGNVKPKSDKQKRSQKQEKTADTENAKEIAKAEKTVKKEESENKKKNVKKVKPEKKENSIGITAPDSQRIDFKERLVFSASHMPANIRNIIDVGSGYGIRINILITGGKLNVPQKNNIQNIVLDMQNDISDQMLQKVIELADDVLSCHGSAGMKTINVLIEEKDKELKTIADDYSINQKLEKAVLASIEESDQDSVAAVKWSAKCNVKFSSSTLKITKPGIMLCLTGGTDNASFLALADNAGIIDTVVSGLLLEEPKLRKEADKSIADFIKDSNRISGMVEDVYVNNKIDEKVTIKKIIDKASSAETAEQDRFVNYLRLKILGYTTADTEGRAIRLRYKSYLADTKKRISIELEKLILEEQKFKSSMIKKTSRSLPEIQKIKKHCSNVMSALSEKEAYTDRIDKKLEALKITIDENTTLHTLKTIRAEINENTIRETLSRSSSALAKSADEIKAGRKAMNDISEILNSGGNLQ